MTVVGQFQTSARAIGVSAFPRIATKLRISPEIRFVPQPDSWTATKFALSLEHLVSEYDNPWGRAHAPQSPDVLHGAPARIAYWRGFVSRIGVAHTSAMEVRRKRIGFQLR